MADADPHHRATFDKLVGGLIGLADQMLAEHGVFHPFGACIQKAGEVAHVDLTAVEDPGDAIAAMAKAAQDLDADVVVLIVDVRVTPPGASTKSDSIMVLGESRHGFVLRAFLPYAAENGAVTYGERFMEPEPDPMFFG